MNPRERLMATLRGEPVDRPAVCFYEINALELEGLPRERFRARAEEALDAGVGGRGFVLMPSSCPYGRVLSPVALANYGEMVAAAEARRAA